MILNRFCSAFETTHIPFAADILCGWSHCIVERSFSLKSFYIKKIHTKRWTDSKRPESISTKSFNMLMLMLTAFFDHNVFPAVCASFFHFCSFLLSLFHHFLWFRIWLKRLFKSTKISSQILYFITKECSWNVIILIIIQRTTSSKSFRQSNSNQCIETFEKLMFQSIKMNIC